MAESGVNNTDNFKAKVIDLYKKVFFRLIHQKIVKEELINFSFFY